MLDSTVLYWCATLAFLPILIALIIGIVNFKYTDSSEKFIIGLMLIACASELISSALWRAQMNNIFISHIYTPIELTLLILYFKSFFSLVVKWGLVSVAVLFSIFALENAFLSNDPFALNDTPRTLECILLILLALLVFGKIMTSFRQEKLTALPVFWFNSAVILYFSSNILLFYFSREVENLSSEINKWIWTVHLFFMTIYYLLFSVGLWKIRQTQR